MKYNVIDRENFFVREDKDATMVLFKERHDQFLLNQTGLMMFNLILENNQTENVLEELKHIYGGVEPDTLKKDLLDIMRMLKMYNIVSIDDDESVKGTEIKGVSAVDENEYEIIGKYIENNRCDDYFIAGGKGYYTPVNIRAHIMNNQEYYYCYKNSDSEIEGVVVIVPNINNISVINITALVLSKNKSDTERMNIAKELLQYSRESMLNKVNKMRISFYANKESDVTFLHLYDLLGFRKEAELKNEYENKNLYLYSMYK